MHKHKCYKRHPLSWLFVTLMSLPQLSQIVSPINVLAQDDPQAEALALLRGAAAARSKVHSFRVELTMTYNPAMGDDGVFKIIIDQSGDQRRLECLPGSKESAVYFLAPDHVRRFIRAPAEDLSVFSIKDAAGRHGVMLFDARGLGLSGSFAVTDTIDGLFWLDIGKSFVMNGEETIGNETASRVVVTSVVGTSEYWISQPAFRVHRRTVRWKSGQLATIDSVFSRDDSESVFPTSIHVASSGANTDIIDVNVDRFDTNTEIDKERFEDVSIGLPANTMRNDYRVQQITGYWDGASFRDDPVGKKELESSPAFAANPVKVSTLRYLITAGIVLACGALMLVIWVRHSA